MVIINYMCQVHVYNNASSRLVIIYVINARRACARGLQYLLCVCVCVCLFRFVAFKSSLYDKVDLPACSSPDFVVSNPH